MDRLRDFGFLLAELSRRYTRRFEQLAQGTGLTLTTCKALAYLERHEGISQARLAELASIDPMALVRLLDRLQAAGVVQRLPDPGDRRAHRVVLCDPARPMLRQIHAISRDARRQAFEGIDAGERENLLRLMRRLSDNLDGATEEALRPEAVPSEPARRVPGPRRPRRPPRCSS